MTATAAVNHVSRKPQYLQINQHGTFYDHRGDAAWMAARIDDDVIYDGESGFHLFFSQFKKGKVEIYLSLWKENIFSREFRDDIADPLDWWHDVLVHESWRALNILFKTRFNSAYGRRLVPRDLDKTPLPEEADWVIVLFIVNGQINLRPSRVRVFYAPDQYSSHSFQPYDATVYGEVQGHYLYEIQVRYSLLVAFASDTHVQDGGDGGQMIPLHKAMSIADAIDMSPMTRYVFNSRVLAGIHEVGNNDTTTSMVYVLSGTRPELLKAESWFLSNAPVGAVSILWSRADHYHVVDDTLKDKFVYKQCHYYGSLWRVPAKHAYMAERASVLMHMLMRPCALGETASPATPLVCVKLPVYVLLWIFDWLPDEYGGWREVAKLRCLTGVQSALRRVLQARPDPEHSAIAKRTRSAKVRDWV